MLKRFLKRIDGNGVLIKILLAFAYCFTPHGVFAKSLLDSGRVVFLSKVNSVNQSPTDFDFLSLIPVATLVNHGTPSILALASEKDLDTNIYLQNYLSRYKPDQAYTINFAATVPHSLTSTTITATSGIALSDTLALRFWQSAEKIVAVTENSYSDALQGSALAAYLKVPLIYFTSAAQVNSIVAKLSVKEVVYIGALAKTFTVKTTTLSSPAEVYNYLKVQKLDCNYFAVTNPTDLAINDGPKQSLIAPMMAARRKGMVVPLQNTTTATNAIRELQSLYTSIQATPQYLALVGSASAIPTCYAPDNLVSKVDAKATDFPYSNIDSDSFPDIAIGRIVTYNIYDASIYASRVSTYRDLLDGNWNHEIIETGSWKSVDASHLYKNYGFIETKNYADQIITDLTSFETSILLHDAHSNWQILGGSLGAYSKNILAPLVMISGGCAVSGIDLDVANNTKQLFKLGAVAFVGAPRNATTIGTQVRTAVANRLLEGASIGEAFKTGTTELSLNWLNNPGDVNIAEARYNIMLAGDPALQIDVPRLPTVKPAGFTVHSDTMTILMSDTLYSEPINQSLMTEWGWKGGSIYYPSSPGVEPRAYWSGAYDQYDLYYTAHLTTNKPVTAIRQLDHFASPLGMVGEFFVDSLPNGWMNVFWSVRMADFNQETGKLKAKIDSIRFKIIQPTTAIGNRPQEGIQKASAWIDLNSPNALVFDLQGRKISQSQWASMRSRVGINGRMVGESKNGQVLRILQIR